MDDDQTELNGWNAVHLTTSYKLLTILLSSQQEGSAKQTNTVHQWLQTLVCVMSNRTFYP